MEQHLDGESNPATTPVGLEVHDVLLGGAQPRAVANNLQCNNFLFSDRPSGGTGWPQLDFS